MKFIEQLGTLNAFKEADVILIDDTIISITTFKNLTSHAGQLLVINAELNSIYRWMSDENLSNIIVATYARDYWQNTELVKQFEARKVGVLCLKETGGNRASLESLLKTLSSLQFKRITCILAKNKMPEFLTSFNPSESFIWQNENLINEKFIGANSLLPQLDLKLIVV